MSLRHFILVKNFFLYICILYNGDIGQLVFFFRGVGALEPKRFKIGGVSFRVISSPISLLIENPGGRIGDRPSAFFRTWSASSMSSNSGATSGEKNYINSLKYDVC